MLNAKSSKLALGTVQFGLNYGISNKNGLVNKDQARLILSQAYKNKIDTIDTAIAYGESEKVLGEIGVSNYNIVTKLPPLPEGIRNIQKWVFDNFYSSLYKLNLNSIYGILLHRSLDILGERGKILYEVLFELKSKGLIENIGASIYDPKELDDMENQGLELDIIQAPFNLFDRRLETSGWLAKLGSMKTKIYIRSVFLQGLLLLPSEQRPQYFSKWTDHFKQWDDWLKANDISALEACLNFLKVYSDVDKFIIGVTSQDQLLEIIAKFENNNKILDKSFEISDQNLINPSNWIK